MCWIRMQMVVRTSVSQSDDVQGVRNVSNASITSLQLAVALVTKACLLLLQYT
jgi:hypothetical protein